MIESSRNRIPLDLPGAKGKVEVTGALGIIAKVEVDGERARAQRGGWPIALTDGSTEPLTVKGYLPGFQRFVFKGETVLHLGSHVRLPEKIAMFSPFLLMLLWVFLAPVSVALFMMNISVVKNPIMPRALRVAMPVINTVAAFVGWVALGTFLSPRG